MVQKLSRIIVTARKVAITGMIKKIPYAQITRTAGILNRRGGLISIVALGFKI